MKRITQYRRSLVALAAGVGVIITASSCSSANTSGENSSGGEATQSFELTVHTGESDLMSRIDQKFADEVAERTDGRIVINPSYSGSLVSPDQVLNSVESGTVDLGHVTTSFASGAIPDLAILEVPYARPADSEGYAEFSAEVDPVLDEIFAEHNQKFIFSNPGIMPGIIACSEPAGADADFSGKLIRAAGPWQSATLAGWGGSPATIGTAELYTSLQNGTVDCTLMVYNLYSSLKLAEVAPYVYRLDFGANYNAITMNQQAWDSLSEADQTAVLAAGAAAQEYGFELLSETVEPEVERLVEAGATLCVPSDGSVDDKLATVDDVRDEIGETVSERGESLAEISEKFREDAYQAPTFGPLDRC
ncbi:TRAP transporter substrate-binding protein DctP [Microbacterium schleiferi]|uniref:TRAP transporter substrate-binding protein n=1 Tax=Microbacterium schleiferi TaxID=69362 RepID=UPI00311EF5FC